MNKEKLIKHCRYYKGEEECPFEPKEGDNSRLLWSYEEKWVRDYEECQSYFLDNIKWFVSHGLGLFEETDNTPISLKALLYNRFDHWTQGGPEDFKEWYKRVYKRT